MSEAAPAHSRAWRDKEGYLWIEAGDPGSGRVFCYDGYLRRRMSTAWPARELDDARAEFGLVPAEAPRQEDAGDEDRVVFLYGRGKSAEVPLEYADVRGWERDGAFAEVIPGYQVAVLAAGYFQAEDLEWLEGTFIVVRRKR